MHPFALNDDMLDQISGGDLVGGTVEDPNTPIAPIGPVRARPIDEGSTDALGEEGGWLPPPPDLV